ncbi:methyltransferase domain-containing protein [Aliidiomarina sp.]|uniref:methyltransferase domain-containing protein n=1 Tax=Aliidiomarina sp. TaxID=1872439 RepID=UPI003A4E0F29
MLAQYDKAAVAKRFTQQAFAYTEHAQVQQLSAHYLLQLLQDWLSSRQTITSKAPFATLLDLGCGPGVNSVELAAVARHYLGVDIAAGMVQAAQEQSLANESLRQRMENGTASFLQADMEQLPLRNDSVTGLYSNLAVQWSNQPQQLLHELYRVLAPGGMAWISTVLNNSLQPFADLRRNYLSQDGVNAQPTLLQWQAWLQQVGFSVRYIEERRETSWFSNLRELIRSVSRIGADQQRTHTAPQLSSREWLSHQRSYELFRTELGLPLHYQLGYFVIQK